MRTEDITDQVYEDADGVLHMPDNEPSLEDFEPLKRPPGVKPIKWKVSRKGHNWVKRGKR